MNNFTDEELKTWILRWDSMQEYYNPDRNERFDTVIGLIDACLHNPKVIVDLGCGTGSIMEKCLLSFPNAKIYGIDFDFILMSFAKRRLKDFKDRVEFIQLDIRNDFWIGKINEKIDAIVSATALHWLNETEMKKLYFQIFNKLDNGGIFLNADHVGNDEEKIMDFWKNKKFGTKYKIKESPWDSFWNDLYKEIGEEAKKERKQAIGIWHGIEDGLPLDWHFQNMKDAGFINVDCFYRYCNDVIYGGIKE
jgi:SAM-dependent methyltransferase